MSYAFKAALLSGLLYPGAGHINLTSYKRGITLILMTSIGFIVLISEAMQRATVIANKIAAEGGVVSVSSVAKALEEMSLASSGGMLGFFMVGLFAIWVLGIVDAYRLGHIKDTGKTLADNC